jgi:hypothetical protein
MMSDGETPIQRLGLWLAINAGLGTTPTHEDVTALIDALGNSSVPESVATVAEHI